MRPLPPIPYEIAEWVYQRKVKYDCHISFEKNNYSCPYQYLNKKVDLKATDQLIEIYYQQERIATHSRFPAYQQYALSTQAEHLPNQFNQPEWNATRIRHWAQKIGPYTAKVIERIFESVQIEEQGYQSALSVLNLTKRFSDSYVNAACHIALERVHSPRYRQLNAILTNPNYKTLLDKNAGSSPPTHLGYVRGSEYYGGSSND